MATVSEMIEWLKTLPPDAIVECGTEVSASYDTFMEMAAVDIESCKIFNIETDGIKKVFVELHSD